MIVLRLIADFLYFYGLLLLIPFLVSLLTGERALMYVCIGQIVIFALGLGILRQRWSTASVSRRQAAVALALTWLLLSLVSSVFFAVGGMTPLDALFEAFSAWTDTGLTMVPHPERLPVSLGVFRILIQWISGLGIVMFMLFLRGTSPRAAHSLFLAEGRFEDFTTNLWYVGRTVGLIYIGYTCVGFMLLWALGVPWGQALAHAVTSLSTGGFSTNNVGVGIYGRLPSIVAMCLMLGGGISFGSHQALLSGDIGKFFRNPEIRALFYIILLASGLLVFELWWVEGEAWPHALESMFYAITAITTCGAGTTLSLSAVPDVYLFTLLVLMISGALYGSTSGALKLWRLIILGKAVRREIRRPFYPVSTLMPIRMGNNLITEPLVLQIATYTLLYLAMGLMGSWVFMLFGYSLTDALFTVFSAQGNVGLNAMPEAAYYGMPAVLKLQLIGHMLMGRVEILPFLYILRSVGNRGRRRLW